MKLIQADEAVIKTVVNAAFTVHKEFGPGLLESAYQKALLYELSEEELTIKSQVDVPLRYKSKEIGTGFRADIIVEDSLLLELKAVDKIQDIHMAQVITYLKLLNFKRALLINFNVRLIKNGIRRVSI